MSNTLLPDDTDTLLIATDGSSDAWHGTWAVAWATTVALPQHCQTYARAQDGPGQSAYEPSFRR